MNYLLNVLIALDQLGNALLGGAPDESISARAYRSEQAGKLLGRVFRPGIDFLFRPFQSDHCRQAYLAELRRVQLPKAYQ